MVWQGDVKQILINGSHTCRRLRVQMRFVGLERGFVGVVRVVRVVGVSGVAVVVGDA